MTDLSPAVADADAAADALRFRRARIATHLQFFVLGLAAAALGVHVPSMRAHYGLGDAQLSLALFAASVGAVLCLLFAGRIIAAWGARGAALGAAIGAGLSLALLLQFDRLPLLMLAMAGLGATVGLFDVAINTEGSYLEQRAGRKMMSAMHGMWSLGGMVGASIGAWLLEHQVPPLLQMRCAALLFAAVALTAGLAMLPTHDVVAGHGAQARRLTDMAAPGRNTLLLLGLLAILGLLAEGAIYDWSVLYVQREIGAEPALSALAFASFSAAMAAGRFGGDWLRSHVHPAALLRACAIVAACAMTLVLWTNSVWVALLGFALVGLGLANVIPLLFVAASRVPGVSAAAGIALVSSLGWIGLLIGPPVVGAVASALSLGWGLMLVVVSSLALAVCAKRVEASGPRDFSG